MKKAVILFLLIAILSSLCACGESTPVINCPPDYAFDRSYKLNEIQNMDELKDGIYKMQQYEGEPWICRISYPELYDKHYEVVANMNVHVKDNFGEYSPEIIIKGTDEMIIKGYSGLVATPIIEMGYTIPYKLKVYNNTIHSKLLLGYAIGGYWEDFEEINGQDPSEFIPRLSANYNLFNASYGEEFSFGYYSGTEFVEDVCVADAFYFIIYDNSANIRLPVTKTKEGYFTVDYSQLSPGYYCFKTGDTNSIINIQ